jgi:putative transcriptional regulator
MSEIAVGRLLLATPLIPDGPFHRSVVLLLSAGTDDGALGVVLGRPSDVEVDRVLPGWGERAAEPSVVFDGGPVQPQAAICLARLRAGVDAGESLAPLPAEQPGPRFATVDLESSPDDVAGAVERLRVFAGYAGWSPGQLEDEVAEGAWWVLDALPEDAFLPAGSELWRQVLRRQGPPLAFAVTLPADPAQN